MRGGGSRPPRGGALAFATLTPAALGPAHRDVRLAARYCAAGFAPPGCDHPRGARFTLPACEAAIELTIQRHRLYAWR